MGRVFEVSLWVVASVAAASAGLTWHRGLSASPPHVTSEMGDAASPATFERDTLSRAARDVVAANLFSIRRGPPASMDQQPAEEPARNAPEEPRRPTLRLTGIVGRSPWEVIIEGLPGRTGVIVAREGERFGDYQIRSIQGDTVIVQGADTMWTLVLERGTP